MARNFLVFLIGRMRRGFFFFLEKRRDGAFRPSPRGTSMSTSTSFHPVRKSSAWDVCDLIRSSTAVSDSESCSAPLEVSGLGFGSKLAVFSTAPRRA